MFTQQKDIKDQLLQRRACFKQAGDITRREFVKQMNSNSKNGMSIITDVTQVFSSMFLLV